MEIIALLRQLADAFEKEKSAVATQAPAKFDIEDPGAREALESLFNTWYEKEYEKVEQKLGELEESIESHEDKFDEMPSNLNDHDLDDMEDRLVGMESKVSEIDEDAINEALKTARSLKDIDLKELSEVDFDELGEMMSFFRALKAHFSPSREKKSAA
jgi:hypothetical protein